MQVITADAKYREESAQKKMTTNSKENEWIIIYALFVFLFITAVEEIDNIQSGHQLIQVIKKCVFVEIPAYIVVSKPGTPAPKIVL